MVNETRRVLKNENLIINATCVRVPIENGHGVSVLVDLKEDFNLNDIKKLLQEQEGIILFDDYPTTMHSYNNDFVYIGRLRKDRSSLLFYVTSDNLRRGASYNSYKILEKLITF